MSLLQRRMLLEQEEEKMWKFVNSVTLEEDKTEIMIEEDAEGGSFKFDELLIYTYVKSTTGTNLYGLLHTEDSKVQINIIGGLSTSGFKDYWTHVKKEDTDNDRDIIIFKSFSNDVNGQVQRDDYNGISKKSKSGKFNKIQIISNLAQGSIIEIYGK